ncbi:MAG: hypothetical protein JOY78_20320 [Pseudonocardia sp.]|nr:hypothetical protein [Pseudonocardia sp.]
MTMASSATRQETGAQAPVSAGAGAARIALAKVGLTPAKVTANIVRVFARATEQDMLDGKCWYAEAQALAQELATAGDLTVLQAACVIAHLSPRQTWSVNKRMARELVSTGQTKGLGGAISRAKAAMVADDPFATFGKAPKTRAFAANIAGDMHAVTIDVWALRVAGVAEAQLGRVGVYEAVAHCYRLAAKRFGITPAQMQAVTWVVARGRA